MMNTGTRGGLLHLQRVILLDLDRREEAFESNDGELGCTSQEERKRNARVDDF